MQWQDDGVLTNKDDEDGNDGERRGEHGHCGDAESVVIHLFFLKRWVCVQAMSEWIMSRGVLACCKLHG